LHTFSNCISSTYTKTKQFSQFDGFTYFNNKQTNKQQQLLLLQQQQKEQTNKLKCIAIITKTL